MFCSTSIDKTKKIHKQKEKRAAMLEDKMIIPVALYRITIVTLSIHGSGVVNTYVYE